MTEPQRTAEHVAVSEAVSESALQKAEEYIEQEEGAANCLRAEDREDPAVLGVAGA